MRPALLPSPKAGALLPPANFPAGGFGDSRSPRRVSLPFAAEARPGFSRRPGVAANTPAAGRPACRGGSCPEHEAGVFPPPALCGGAASLLPGRAADPLYLPAGRLDLPATLTWSIPPREVAALAATLVFGIAAIVWFAALSGGL